MSGFDLEVKFCFFPGFVNRVEQSICCTFHYNHKVLSACKALTNTCVFLWLIWSWCLWLIAYFSSMVGIFYVVIAFAFRLSASRNRVNLLGNNVAQTCWSYCWPHFCARCLSSRCVAIVNIWYSQNQRQMWLKPFPTLAIFSAIATVTTFKVIIGRNSRTDCARDTVDKSVDAEGTGKILNKRGRSQFRIIFNWKSFHKCCTILKMKWKRIRKKWKSGWPFAFCFPVSKFSKFCCDTRCFPWTVFWQIHRGKTTSLMAINMHALGSVGDVPSRNILNSDANAQEICCMKVLVQFKLANKPLRATHSLLA